MGANKSNIAASQISFELIIDIYCAPWSSAPVIFSYLLRVDRATSPRPSLPESRYGKSYIEYSTTDEIIHPQLLRNLSLQQPACFTFISPQDVVLWI